MPEIEALAEPTMDWMQEQRGHRLGAMLDVGANYGWWLAQYRERGGYGIGVDVAPQRVDGVDEVVLHVEPTTRLSTIGRPFDVVTFVHSLEHLPNYTQALADARALLRPGGAVFVAVPHPDSVDWLHPDGGHLTLFTEGLLRQALTRFDAVTVETHTLRPDRPELWALAVKA